MKPFFKVFIEFVTVLFLFYVLVFWPGGMWDISSQPGTEHTPFALEDEVLTTGPPGKSLKASFYKPNAQWILRPLMIKTSTYHWYYFVFEYVLPLDQIRSDQSLSRVRLFATP